MDGGEKCREPAFCAKSRFPNPPAKTLIFSTVNRECADCRVRAPKSVISPALRKLLYDCEEYLV